jgi:hypothetical protein
MAWSPQARAAAIAARKARAHGSSKKLAVTRHPMIAMNGHHGVRDGRIQPTSQLGHRGQQIRKNISAKHAMPIRQTAGRAYVAGLTAGTSEKKLKRAGLHKSQKNLKQTHQFRRVAAYTAGSYTTGAAIGLAISGASIAHQRYGRKATYHAKTSPRYAKTYAKSFAHGAKSGYQNRRAAQRNMRRTNFHHATATRVAPKALNAGTGRRQYVRGAARSH